MSAICPLCPVYMMPDKKEKFSSDYDKYIDSIYRFVYIKVNSEYISEDICSDIFTKYWKTIQKGTEIDNPRAFLYRIARTTVIDYYRKKGRIPTLISTDDTILRDDESLEDKTDLSLNISIIQTHISDLKDDYQDVIIWHYLDDLSIKEISITLDKSETAVRMLLSRALSKLRDSIK